MEDLPSNSNTVRVTPARDVIKPLSAPAAEPKKVEKVVTGDIIRRKKPLGKRVKELLVGGDAQSVSQYILLSVIIPNVKDLLFDVLTQGGEKMIFGEVRSGSRRFGARPSAATGHVNYNRMSSSPMTRREEPRVSMSQRARAAHDFDEIILSTRIEAEEVIDGLYSIIERYDQATVADLLDLCGVTSQFTDQKWGWTELRGAAPRRVNGGYLLDLPKPEQLTT